MVTSKDYHTWFYTKIVTGLLLLLFSPVNLIGLKAQPPLLEREITLSAENQPIHVILNTIAAQADFGFSYNPTVINPEMVKTIVIQQNTVRHALYLLFGGEIKYKEKGNYIILTKNKLYQNPEAAPKKEQTVEGYITDARTGRKLNEVTVYDKNLLISALTNDYGYFQMEIPNDGPNPELYVTKKGYIDTLITPLNIQLSYVTVALSSDIQAPPDGKLKVSADGYQNYAAISEKIISKKILIHSGNITEPIFTNVQFSAFPFLSTNKFLTGSTVNNVSINLTAGYIRGVRFVEIGGVLNIVRENASACQLAGGGNFVGGTFRGFQTAGVYNISSEMKGVQLSGALNVVKRDASIFQAAGVGNIDGNSFRGAQIAGVFNHAKDAEGIEIAGVYNIVSNSSGVQLAGVFNQSKNSKGLQLAGVFNNSNESSGVQIAGLFNRAKYIRGLQLSVFNFADSCNGVPIGVFNFIKKGYHKLEISGDELFYTNVAFRTGVARFHNILTAGIRPGEGKEPLWTFGYGLGTTFNPNGKLLYDIDIVQQQVIRGSFDDAVNTLYKFYAGIERKLISNTSIAAGITYNFMVADTREAGYEQDYSSIVPYTFSDNTYSNGYNLKTWLGGKLAIRFF